MTKTFNRTPFSVREPNFEYKFFNHVNWKGLCTDKNYFNIDQETFEDCENVYIDSEGLLKSRPAIKTVAFDDLPAVFKAVSNSYQKPFKIYDVKDNASIFTIRYTNDNEICYVVGNSDVSTSLIILGEDRDNLDVSLMLDDNVFLFFLTPDSSNVKNNVRINVSDISTGNYLFDDVSNYIYKPIKNIFTNGVKKENESENLFTTSYVDRYIYDEVNSLVNPPFTGKTVDIRTASESIEYKNVEFKQGSENLIFVPGVNLSEQNYYISYRSTEKNIKYSLVDVADNGVILMSYYTRKIDDFGNVIKHWRITYSTDGKIFNTMPSPSFDVFGTPIISRDGSFVVVFGANGPYAYSILSDLPNDQKRFDTWTNLLIYNNISEVETVFPDIEIGVKAKSVNNVTDEDILNYINAYDNDIISGYFYNHSEFIFCYGTIIDDDNCSNVLKTDGKFVCDGLVCWYVNGNNTSINMRYQSINSDFPVQILNAPIKIDSVKYSNQEGIFTRFGIKYLIDARNPNQICYDVLDYCYNENVKKIKHDVFLIDETNLNERYKDENDDKSNFKLIIPDYYENEKYTVYLSRTLYPIFDIVSGTSKDNWTPGKVSSSMTPVTLGSVPNITSIEGYPSHETLATPLNMNVNFALANSMLFDGDKNLYVSKANKLNYYTYDSVYDDYYTASLPASVSNPLTSKEPTLLAVEPITLAVVNNIIYTNSWQDETLLIDVTNEGEITPIFFDHETTLNVKYLSKGNTLYISSNRYDEDGNKLIYFPKINEQNENFTSNITNLHPISKTQVGIFFEDEIWYVENTEQGYNYYKSKLKVGCKEGGDVITSADGQHIIFSTNRGLAYMSYQDFVQSTDQTLKFLSDAISELYFEFAKKPVKLFQYKYWIICWHTNENDFLVFDARNNSWWKWSWRKKIKCIHTINDELYFVSTEDNNPLFCYSIDKSDVDYSDDGEFIKWSLTSQKLHLGTLNYYKNIHSIAINNVQTGDNINEVSFDMSIVNYRNQVSNRYEEPVNIEYQVNLLRSYVKRCNSKKVNEFQYRLSNADERIIQHMPLSVNSIIIKYSLGGQIR